MGASTNSGGGRHKRRGRRQYSPVMSEINVTPFVDVMLVLLIIFMVTAPLLSVGVPVDLPKTKAQQLSGNKEPLVISINAKGRVFLQETEIELDDIVAKLAAIRKNAKKETIYVRGDKGLEYGLMMKVMGRLSNAGFTRMSLVTDGEN